MKMQLLIVVLFILRCSADLKVSIDAKGGYQISINNSPWLRSSRTAVYVDNQWYSSEDNSLPLRNITSSQGTDPVLGSWIEAQLNYDLVRSGVHTNIIGRIRQWQSYSAVTFHLETGDQEMINTVPLDVKNVRTVFPSFEIEQIGSDDQRGYFTYASKRGFDSIT